MKPCELCCLSCDVLSYACNEWPHGHMVHVHGVLEMPIKGVYPTATRAAGINTTSTMRVTTMTTPGSRTQYASMHAVSTSLPSRCPMLFFALECVAVAWSPLSPTAAANRSSSDSDSGLPPSLPSDDALLLLLTRPLPSVRSDLLQLLSVPYIIIISGRR